MSNERIEYVAYTAAGVAIYTTSERDMALNWWDLNEHHFPGATLECVRTRTTVSRWPLCRSYAREAA